MIAQPKGPAPGRDPVADPDARLMLRVRAGDAAAFDKLVLKHHPQVVWVITRLMGNDRHSDDLAQEVFLRVFRARDSYVVTARFSSWLFTIVHNVVFNARRSLARRRETTLQGRGDSCHDPLDHIRADAHLDTPLRAAIRGEVERVVHLALAGLCDRQQTALSLFYFEGLSYAAIADAMETSREAIRSLLQRARTSIRQSLTPYVEHGHWPVCRGRLSDSPGPREPCSAT